MLSCPAGRTLFPSKLKKTYTNVSLKTLVSLFKITYRIVIVHRENCYENSCLPFQLAVMATGVHPVRSVDIVRLEISVIKLQDIVHIVK